jgi:hypothetical protein
MRTVVLAYAEPFTDWRCTMNTKILRFGTREAVRHPRGTVRLSAAAIKYRRAILAAAQTAERARHYGATVRETAANPKVRAETRLALTSLVLAGQRARKVGIASASSDKRVLAQLRHARRHAGRAVTTARNARRRQRVIRAVTVIAGAGAVGGAAYAGWKVRAQPESAPAAAIESSSPDTTTTAA